MATNVTKLDTMPAHMLLIPTNIEFPRYLLQIHTYLAPQHPLNSRQESPSPPKDCLTPMARID
jgi:hypothetical protein